MTTTPINNERLVVREIKPDYADLGRVKISMIRQPPDAVELIEKRIRHFDRLITRAVEDDADDTIKIGNLLAGQHALKNLLEAMRGSHGSAATPLRKAK